MADLQVIAQTIIAQSASPDSCHGAVMLSNGQMGQTVVIDRVFSELVFSEKNFSTVPPCLSLNWDLFRLSYIID